MSNQQQDDLDRQLTALRIQVAQSPAIREQIDSCRHELDSCLASFSNSRDADGLMNRLRAAGERRGLADLQAEPELRSLLNVSRSTVSPQSSLVRLDTVVVTLSARGQFFALGAWLDEIEHRPDFRTWISCRWSRGDEDNRAFFEGRVILLMADRLDSVARPVTGGV
jgi:hypothetical protein